MGDKTAQYLSDLDNPKTADVRHKGAMLAFELVDASGNPDTSVTADLKVKSFEKVLLLASCGRYDNAIRIIVPPTVSDELLEEGLAIIKESL